MSVAPSLCDDCCLLQGIDLNAQRVRQLLERRFTSHSNRISFDYKSLPPEQPSNNAKVSRSFLRVQPQVNSSDDSEECLSSDSDSSEEDADTVDTEVTSSSNDDDYYNKLAEWEPESFQRAIETDVDDDDEDEEENTTKTVIEEHNATNEMDISSGLPASDDISLSPVEDVLVTFSRPAVKEEPMHHDDGVFDNPPQLDGHVDLSCAQSSNHPNPVNHDQRLNEVIARLSEKAYVPKKTIQLHRLPPTTPKFRSTDETRKKPANHIPRKSLSSPAAKIDRPRAYSARESKPSKKPTPRLLTSLMKNNGDAIRESDVQLSSNHHRTSRVLSESGAQSAHSKPRNQGTTSAYPYGKPLAVQKQSSAPTSSQNMWLSKGKSAVDHMKLAQRKLSSLQVKQQSKPKEKDPNLFKPAKPIDPQVHRSLSAPKPLVSNDHPRQVKRKKTKKVKRLNPDLSKASSSGSLHTAEKSSSKTSAVNGNGISKKPSRISNAGKPSRSIKSSREKGGKRSPTFFDDCIIIDDSDDDDIQEIERQQYSIAYDIRARQKDLDHIVHSPAMHVKWLFNLEYLLLDHILICHENNRCPCHKTHGNAASTKCDNPSNVVGYQIEPSFISTIIINFIKIFLLRNSYDDQQEFSFVQFGITSHLRYLLIELPTYVHNESRELDDDCSKCHQYSLIINILFDLLFDLVEYDLCGMNKKVTYRSSLIEDDYFLRFLQSKITKKNPFYRIKLVIYFIELLGIHMSKCRSKKCFQFNQSENKLFHSIEDFLRHIVSHMNNMINERVAICFNVMELCLLFANEKAIRIKQMAMFLTELCKNNTTHSNLFLFDENLLVDIRLLLINEFIGTKFHRKLTTISDINALFQEILVVLNPKEPIDETALLLLRGLLNAYADLITEIKTIPALYSSNTQLLTSLFRNQFEVVFRRVVEVSFDDSSYFKQMERTLIFFRLLKCKWNQL